MCGIELNSIFKLSLFLLQIQQVLDSFIIFVAQQTTDVDIEMPIVPPPSASSLKIPWTQYSPSHIRIVPFPTREYTDDEFQSIVKTVMGILYVSISFANYSIITINRACCCIPLLNSKYVPFTAYLCKVGQCSLSFLQRQRSCKAYIVTSHSTFISTSPHGHLSSGCS